jgi:hypothetical protein
MASNPDSGYTGFENPDELYYGYSPTLPTVYTGSYQIRQFGAGDARCSGHFHTITHSLANAPAAMTTAESDSLIHAAALFAVTQNDLDYYHPHS